LAQPHGLVVAGLLVNTQVLMVHLLVEAELLVLEPMVTILVEQTLMVTTTLLELMYSIVVLLINMGFAHKPVMTQINLSMLGTLRITLVVAAAAQTLLVGMQLAILPTHR
jgi:hypothetical protein